MGIKQPLSAGKGENVSTHQESTNLPRRAVKMRKKGVPAPPMDTQVKNGILISTIPMVTVSEANTKEHWSISSKRHKRQKLLVRLALNGHVCQLQSPYHVTIVRHAPGTLDIHDNLPTALKWIVDGIADMLLPGQAVGRADSDPRISWHFNQTRSPVHYIWIRIESLSNDLNLSEPLKIAEEEKHKDRGGLQLWQL